MKEAISFLFYKLPEAFLLLLTALGLLGLKIRPGRLVMAGLGLGALTEVSRYFLFNLGLHTPVILVGLISALVLGFELSVTTAILGCFLSFFLLLMGESLLMSPILTWTKIPFQAVLNDPWLYICFGWISSGFLVIATGICHLGGFALIKAPEAQKTVTDVTVPCRIPDK